MQLPSSDQTGGSAGPEACPDESAMLAFVEGRLALGDRGTIDVHLSTCSECRQLISALAQGGLVLGETRHVSNATPAATALLPSSPPHAGSAPPAALPPASTSPLLRPGDRVADRYVVERAIGSGGMGVVVAAKHLGLGRTFAIKLLDPRYAGSAEATNRFLREARASAQLRSEHVVQVTDMGETQLPDRSKAPFLVMELLDGTDLSKTTSAKKALPPLEAVWIILQACEALAEAHAAGIVHRDIKPANLIVTHKVDGTPHLKVVDFGISKAHDIARSLGSLTSQNVVMGTPRYMAPEQMRSSKDVDGRADVWALGSVLYELLAGAPAFDAPSLTELITRVQLEEPVSLTARAPHVPAGLADVVHRTLRKNPAERVATVADLAELLGPFAPAQALHHVERTRRSLGGARPSIAPSMQPPVASAAPRSMPAANETKSDERRVSAFTLVAFSLGALLLGIGITAGILFFKQREGPEPPRADTSTVPTAGPRGSAVAQTPGTPSAEPTTLTNTMPLALPSATQAATAPRGTQGVSVLHPVSPPGSATTRPRNEPTTPSGAATQAPTPVAPPPATNTAPEDPHSLRQRQ